MIKVKICGMMREKDVELARKADYVGFVIETGTRRSLTMGRAKELMSVASQVKVTVTTSTDLKFIRSLVSALEPDVVQVHSMIATEDLESLSNSMDCELWGLVPMGKGGEVERAFDLFPYVDAIVLDTATPQGGGSGEAHDWQLAAEVRRAAHTHPVVLSGGLTPSNVIESVRVVRPAVVDVSSGVEADGIKSKTLIDEFIAAVKGTVE